ncbi:helix-turn-helix domain-containing protein [Puniceicoccus vermicola]|uniref:Helix-turn-helix transcriptional regulator n=1 Tax=Puniceicoccus vermicola TaxID=388746 RepID=A0A7X1E5M6_9BACT|nr:helix-turn-helix transcriptional regulator [Puniceicoccus vermicola]
MEDCHKELQNRLRELRHDANLTQEAVSELSGLSYKHYQALEAGRKSDVRLSSLCMIAKAYQVEPWELLYSQKPVLSPAFHRSIRNLKNNRSRQKRD